MYESFHVKNFRCFDDLELNNLARVNLIAGKNNTGKTSLLEAIMLHSGKDDVELMLRIWTSSGIKSFPNWNTIFHRLNETNKIVLEGVYNTEHSILEVKFISPGEMKTPFIAAQPIEKVLEFKYYKTGSNRQTPEMSYFMLGQDKWERWGTYRNNYNFTHPAIFLRSRDKISPAENAQRFRELDISGNLDFFVETLRIIEPRLKSVSLDYRSNLPMLQGHVGLGEAVPLAVMGEGMEHIAALILAIGSAREGIVLADEIENGFHYSVLQDVWKAIGKAAELFNVQVFATTHSWECIVAAHQALSGGGNFRYHRLNRLADTGKITVTTYEPEILASAIETNFEIR